MSSLVRLVAGLAVLLALTSGLGSCGNDDTETVVVFAAASLTDAYQELAALYEADHPDVNVELVLAGSNQLARQIVDGGPAQVFAPADPDLFELLISDGIDVEPITYATNVIVLAVPIDNPAGLTTVGDHRGEVLVAACAEQVPCGDATRSGLAALGIDLDADTLEPDVRAVRTKLDLGEVDAGFVYATDLVGDNQLTSVGPPLPGGTSYAIGTIGDASDPTAFTELVLSDAGRAILEKWGFR